MELSDTTGTLVHLSYLHNENRQDLLHTRAGFSKATEIIRPLLKGYPARILYFEMHARHWSKIQTMGPESAALIAVYRAKRGMFPDLCSSMGIRNINLKEIERKIHLIRGRKVMLDSDLAILYEVETKNLNKAVNRNNFRFPEDFMFQLTEKEAETLRFQFGTSKVSRGGRRTYPFAFTQEGIAMLSGVLRSQKAIEVNIAIMRTFVQLRLLISDHRGLAEKLARLEERYDRQFKTVFDAIREILSVHAVPRKRITGLARQDK